MITKLNIDSLNAEIGVVQELLNDATEFEDTIGKVQYTHRLDELKRDLAQLSENKVQNNASLAVFFAGKPVIGSEAISANFAGEALKLVQSVISKVFASSMLGELGQRGKVPFDLESNLMITGLSRGSFGFVLNEIQEQPDLLPSNLSEAIDKAARLLANTAAEDERPFDEALKDLENRTLIALQDLFTHLDANKASIRVVENDYDFTLDMNAIRRAKKRVADTKIDNSDVTIQGTLIGFMPMSKKFELKKSDETVISGKVSKEAVEQFQSRKMELNEEYAIVAQVRKIKQLNRKPREVYTLSSFET